MVRYVDVRDSEDCSSETISRAHYQVISSHESADQHLYISITLRMVSEHDDWGAFH